MICIYKPDEDLALDVEEVDGREGHPDPLLVSAGCQKISTL